MLGTAAYDEGCAQLFCETNIISSLIELLKAHQEDDEIVLQILFMFQVALCHDKPADLIISKTGTKLIENLIKNSQHLTNCRLCGLSIGFNAR